MKGKIDANVIEKERKRREEKGREGEERGEAV